MELNEVKTLIDTYHAAGKNREDTVKLISAIPINGESVLAFEYVELKYKAVPGRELTEYNLTDAGNAEYFTAQYGDKLRYDHRRGRWLCWDRHYWKPENDGQIMRLALKATRDRYKATVNIADLKLREKIAGWAIGSEQRSRLEACIAIARTLKPIADSGDHWDTNGWLFCVENGVVDLRTGILRPGKQEDMITMQSRVNHDSEAKALRWLQFIDQITGGNAELQTYLQRAVGYSLTGETKQQVFFFSYGLGNNGKSTFLNTIRRVMGDYSHKLDIDDIMVKDKRTSSGAKEGLADLQGKRFVLASEIPDGRRLDVGLIKDMTGGETIRARRLYEHHTEYQPTHKLWLMGNHKPEITDTTLSIWRRVKLIPFTITIPDEDIDPDFPLKLEPELPGILAWAIQGCQDWQRYGLGEPPAVTTATAIYRHDSDILGDFLDDCCKLTATIPKSELKVKYLSWCEATGVEPVKQHTFRNRLLEKGITEGRSSDHKTRIWKGIRLITDNELADEIGQIGQKFSFDRTKVTPKSVKSPTEISHEDTLQKTQSEMSEMSEMSENLVDLPDCPKCGKNEWTASESVYVCPCGNTMPMEGG